MAICVRDGLEQGLSRECGGVSVPPPTRARPPKRQPLSGNRKQKEKTQKREKIVIGIFEILLTRSIFAGREEGEVQHNFSGDYAWMFNN
jgi:hypothetical protein